MNTHETAITWNVPIFSVTLYKNSHWPCWIGDCWWEAQTVKSKENVLIKRQVTDAHPAFRSTRDFSLLEGNWLPEFVPRFFTAAIWRRKTKTKQHLKLTRGQRWSPVRLIFKRKRPVSIRNLPDETDQSIINHGSFLSYLPSVVIFFDFP